MSLKALKTIKYRGATLKRGDVLDPPPDPTLAGQLLRGRFVFDDQQTTATTRPAGTGRAKRARQPAA